ncbi:MAG: FIST N-terminal domain-containing protein, partial [Methanobacteriota archaeon]
RDELVGLHFHQKLVEGLNIPFLGVRVSSVLTNGGLVDDGVVFAVFCGDFDVDVIQERMDFDDLDSTVGRLNACVGGWHVAVTFSSNLFYQNVFVDYVLRRINLSNPSLQIVGGNSAPTPTTFSREGIFDDSISMALFRGLDSKYLMDAGFSYSEGSETLVVTKSDEFHINEFNNMNAVTYYCSKKHIQPYFFNMLTKTVMNPRIGEVFSRIYKTNKEIMRGITKGTMEAPGFKVNDSVIEPLFYVEGDEKGSKLLTQQYMPEGRELKWLKTDAESQFKMFERVLGKLAGSSLILGFVCDLIPFYFEYNFEKLQKIVKKQDSPVLLSFHYGEIGGEKGKEEKLKNFVHAGSVQAIGFN